MTPEQKIAAEVAASLATHKHNDVELTLVVDETKAREGKSTVKYWKLDFDALAVVDTTTDEKGNTTKAVNHAATLAVLTKLYGYETLVNDIIAAKANQNIKAAQLETGKDVYNVEQKLTYARNYIDADFGATSRGGAGIAQAFKDLKASNEAMANITKRLFEIAQQIANPTVSVNDKVKLVAEMQALSAQVPTAKK